MKWMIPEDKLGEDQREVITDIAKISNQPIWIQGYAGSGKSVLLLHALKDYLARKPNASVCVAVFTWSLVDLLSTGLRQIPYLKDKTVPVLTIYQLRTRLQTGTRYHAIFCDEVQDLPIEVITLLKMSCDHLIVAGDAVQSIYTEDPVLHLPTASSKQIVEEINPLERPLKVIYRLSRSIVAVLKNVFPDMLAERTVIGKEDTEIKLFRTSSIDEEIRYTWREANETNNLRANEVIAILLYGRNAIVDFANGVLQIENKPTWARVELPNNGPDLESLSRHLAANNIPLMFVGNSHGSLTRADSENKIVIMTYHSAKGLDFDYVYLPMVGTDMYLNRNVPVSSLLLVALSRSKSGLTITFTGHLYAGYRKFLSNITIRPIQQKNESSDEIVF